MTAGWTYSDGTPHRAIDLRAAVGTPVFAAEAGTVDWVQTWDGRSTSGDQSYGSLVRLTHAPYKGGKLQTLYAHLSRICVAQGQQLREGQLIGYSGATGNVTGPHLHFEVRLAAARCNPLNWLDDDFTTAYPTVRLGSYTSVVRPADAPDGSAPAELAAGAALRLAGCPLYAASTAADAAGTVSGTYYLWDGEQANGRVRITNRADLVGAAGQVTGWIAADDAAAALAAGGEAESGAANGGTGTENGAESSESGAGDAPAQPTALLLTLADTAAAATIAAKAAALGLAPVVAIATQAASSGDYATLRDMTLAAGGSVRRAD